MVQGERSYMISRGTGPIWFPGGEVLNVTRGAGPKMVSRGIGPKWFPGEQVLNGFQGNRS